MNERRLLQYCKERYKQLTIESIDGQLFIPVFVVQHTECCKILKQKSCCHTLQPRTCNKRALAYEANLFLTQIFTYHTHAHAHTCVIACAALYAALDSFGVMNYIAVIRDRFPPISIITVTFTTRHKALVTIW